MITKSFCSVRYHHIALALRCSPHIFGHIYTLIPCSMTGSPIPPPGIYSGRPFPLRSSSAPLSPSELQLTQEATPARADPDVELFKVVVERTECANVRISKLNLLQKRRTLDSQSPADVSDDEPEESLRHISPSTELILFMTAIFGHACLSSLRSQALQLSA